MKPFLITSLLVIALTGSTQDADFKKIMNEVKSNLKEVKSGDKTFEHTLEILHTSVVKYKVVEEDSKGNRKASIFEFNVSDLDPYLVREETKRDVIYLNLTVDNEQKFIKEYLNEEVKGYKSSISIVTNGIDDARRLKDLIKKAIPSANEIMERKLAINSYDEMKTWLLNNVGEAENATKSYEQKLEVNKNYPGSFRLVQTEITSRSSTERRYDFNLADINVNSLKFNIVGSSLSLNFETKRKQNLIKESEVGDPKGFENEIEIFTNNVEEARDLKSVLTMAVPLVEEKLKNTIQPPTDKAKALDYLGQFVKKVNYEGEVLEQQISGDCILSYSTTKSNSKSSETHKYTFNLMDVDINLMDIDISFNKMFIKVSTKGSVNLIKDYENDEFDRYTDEIKIYADNIEVARRLKLALENMVGLCEKTYKDPFETMNTNQQIDWLEQNLGEIRVNDETITQKFERNEGSDPDKFKLTRTTVTTKGGIEEVFEFNFSDLNPKSIQYNVRGKSLSVSFETNFSENIIKYYKNGEIGNYQDGFKLVLNDIEKARKVIRAFNLIIDELND